MQYRDRGYQPRTWAWCCMCGDERHDLHVWEYVGASGTYYPEGIRRQFPQGTKFTCAGDCTDAFIVEQRLTARREKDSTECMPLIRDISVIVQLKDGDTITDDASGDTFVVKLT